MKIRRFKKSDAETCFLIRAENHIIFNTPILGAENVWRSIEALPPSFFARAYREKNRPFFVVEERGKIVGFFDLNFKKGGTEAFIFTFHVRRSHHAKGVGRKMIEFAVDWLRKNKPKVTILSADSIAHEYNRGFYEKLGFTQVSTGTWEGMLNIHFHKKI